MTSTFRLGKIAGIPIGVHWSIVVVAALLTTSLAGSLLPSVLPGAHGSYWAAAILAAGLFFASILAHELSHALVARHYGQKVEDITLWLLGGVSRLGSESPSPRAELLVALAGPGMSLALGGAFFGVGELVRTLAGTSTLLSVVLIWLGAINVILGVFNLLPGSPLDGGRVVSALLWMRNHDHRQAQIGAARAGRVVGAILIALGLMNLLFGIGVGTLWTAFVGWFIFEASVAEERAARASRALDGRRVRDVMTANPPEAPAWVHAIDVRRSFPPPDAHQHTLVLRDYDGSVHATVPIETVRNAPDTATLRDLAQPAIVAPPDAYVLDVLRDAPAVGSVVVMQDNHLLGVIGPDEMRAAEDAKPLAPTA
ncbi:MAG: rip3 [Actinomycetia bacterium]|jgi:Zn-dependent protease|nr:rip3 [Actinomycetes bacterium]